MFAPTDFTKYFNELLLVEQNMEKEALQILEVLKNAEAREIVERILNDERRHIKIVEDLLKMVENE